jgi:hypothetical protein
LRPLRLLACVGEKEEIEAYRITKVQLHDEKAKVEYGACYCDATNWGSVEAIRSHVEKYDEDAELKS